jgi:hypothetical protein
MPKHESQSGGAQSDELRISQSELSHEQLFGLWVDQQLNDQQRHEFEQRCLENESFAEKIQTFNMFSMQSEHYQSDEVPSWDRVSTFDTPEKVKWWQ